MGNKININDIKKYVESVNYKLASDEIERTAKSAFIWVKCDCGHDPYRVSWYKFKHGSRCKKCRDESLKLTNEQVLNIIKNNPHN